ncbi:MAG: hypothetical protein PUB96_08715 [Helicobacteraceae bacterium]|nr:hypothetical protein [Helicobacteraceae bacterium]
MVPTCHFERQRKIPFRYFASAQYDKGRIRFRSLANDEMEALRLAITKKDAVESAIN